ncbi:UNVERIFIED_CONTAM: hypothetical protein Sangu_2957600 [Sesamum angustifolium]|uniref:Uncharacterized protein n=1 Tax=Sesamum angustifolium TaxID=2727405 RepID=A0AAW2IL22_9LAMI
MECSQIFRTCRHILQMLFAKRQLQQVRETRLCRWGQVLGVLDEISIGGYPGGFTSAATTARYLASLLVANDVYILTVATPESDSSGCRDEAEGV